MPPKQLKRPHSFRASTAAPAGLEKLPRRVGKRHVGSETDLVRATLKALELRRVWAWRVNSGARIGIKLAPTGTPDIVGIVPGSNGQLFGLEAKTSAGKMRPSQVAWHNKATDCGVKVGTFRTVAEALELLRSWGEVT